MLTLWVIAISGFMLLMQRVNFEIFFVLSLIGFLVVVLLISPKYTQSGHLPYIQYLIAAATVIFGLIVVGKILEIFAQ
jgi:sensor histidine kinase YesM